jgi:hypothetical protein
MTEARLGEPNLTGKVLENAALSIHKLIETEELRRKQEGYIKPRDLLEAAIENYNLIMRFGSIADRVLGIEVVYADGNATKIGDSIELSRPKPIFETEIGGFLGGYVEVRYMLGEPRLQGRRNNESKWQNLDPEQMQFNWNTKKDVGLIKAVADLEFSEIGDRFIAGIVSYF